MASKYPFKNLALNGGGVKAFAYLGAIEVIEKRRVLRKIEQVAVNSAGSIMATMISFGSDVKESIKAFDPLDYSKVFTTIEDEEPKR